MITFQITLESDESDGSLDSWIELQAFLKLIYLIAAVPAPGLVQGMATNRLSTRHMNLNIRESSTFQMQSPSGPLVLPDARSSTAGFHFLFLPPEIRLLIYSKLLVQSNDLPRTFCACKFCAKLERNTLGRDCRTHRYCAQTRLATTKPYLSFTL